MYSKVIPILALGSVVLGQDIIAPGEEFSHPPYEVGQNSLAMWGNGGIRPYFMACPDPEKCYQISVQPPREDEQTEVREVWASIKLPNEEVGDEAEATGGKYRALGPFSCAGDRRAYQNFSAPFLPYEFFLAPGALCDRTFKSNWFKFMDARMWYHGEERRLNRDCQQVDATEATTVPGQGQGQSFRPWEHLEMMCEIPKWVFDETQLYRPLKPGKPDDKE